MKSKEIRPSKVQVSVSILGADYGDLNRFLKPFEPIVDSFHADIMDGQFVDNLTVGASVIRTIKTKKPIVCHLMVNHPDHYLEEFAEAGASAIIIHAEASENLGRDLKTIRKLGCEAGVSINPETPVYRIDSVLPIADLVLVMSVHPGHGGQAFMPEILPKISAIRSKYPEIDIAVDGGINDLTAPAVVKAGANILVAGSYLLKAKSPKTAAEALRKLGA
jgi:ribulose-phosphate 3-epimerase